MDQGVGFLVLWLVHLLGMNLLSNLHRQSNEQLALAGVADTAHVALRRRFCAYRLLVRLTTVTATIGLALWLVSFRGPSV